MSFSLTVLGSNSALPTSTRFSTAQVLNFNERFFLFDCGEGTQIQLRRAKVGFSKINNIFISHLHADHYLGIFGLISSFNLLGRKYPLNIFGPPELKEIVEFHLNFQEHTLLYKINFINSHVGTNEVIHEDKYCTVRSFPLKHRISTYGFSVEEKPKQANIRKEMIAKYGLSISEIVQIKNGSDLHLTNGNIIPNEQLTIPPAQTKKFSFCTDTRYTESIIPYVSDSDLLYHEATFLKDMLPRAKQTAHSTAEEAALIAKKSNAKKLLIGHFSARYHDISGHLQEAKAVFNNTELAVDCQSYHF